MGRRIPQHTVHPRRDHEHTNSEYLRHTADVHRVGLLPRQVDRSRQVLQQHDPDHVVPREPVEVVDAELQRAVLQLRVADVESERLVELRVERLAVYLCEECRRNQTKIRKRIVKDVCLLNALNILDSVHRVNPALMWGLKG